MEKKFVSLAFEANENRCECDTIESVGWRSEMDAELLGARLAATEAAVLKIDERLDAMGQSGVGEDALSATREARTAALEERLTECLDQLKTLQNSILETEQAIVEAEVV